MIKESSNERNGLVPRGGLRKEPFDSGITAQLWKHPEEGYYGKKSRLGKRAFDKGPLWTSPIPTSTAVRAFFRHHRGLSGCPWTSRSWARLLSVLLFPLIALGTYFSCLSKPHPYFLLFKPFFPTNHILFPLDLSALPTPAEEVGLHIAVIHGSLFLLVNRARGLCLARGNPLKPDRFGPQ